MVKTPPFNLGAAKISQIIFYTGFFGFKKSALTSNHKL